jgi:hypothetical protein
MSLVKLKVREDENPAICTKLPSMVPLDEVNEIDTTLKFSSEKETLLNECLKIKNEGRLQGKLLQILEERVSSSSFVDTITINNEHLPS